MRYKIKELFNSWVFTTTF